MTMTKRTLAAVILAALPLATGTLRSDAIRPAAPDAARSVAGHAAGPQWSFAMGEGAQLIACPMSGWSCLLYIM